jgi:sulfane dehydrogenase subunit SoxC
MTSVKWLDRIDAVAESFDGYQMEAYRFRQSQDDAGQPVNLIQVRALMIPPGIPDFLTRTRVLEPGTVALSGRAWVGRSDVSRVEVSVDGGARWAEAQLGERISTHAWRSWSYRWEAAPGKHILCVRATDTAGNVQPLDQPWNYHGMGNNMVQRVEVVVESARA